MYYYRAPCTIITPQVLYIGELNRILVQGYANSSQSSHISHMDITLNLPGNQTRTSRQCYKERFLLRSGKLYL